jgi:tetratricopeptide (TPR) repeat protein
MPDSFPTDGSRALDGVSDAHRDAKIEQLLLAGLDHYFAARYEQAINVWTRALFFDRSHPRARAYIDRARSALAEQQRETEELLHAGVAAFDRGESGEAKRLLRAALDRGAPADEARTLLDRLSHVRADDDAPPPGHPAGTAVETPAIPAASKTPSGARPRAGLGIMLAAAIVAATGVAAYWFAVRDGLDVRSILDLQDAPAGAAAAPSQSRDVALPLPRRADLLLDRARALAAGGRLREALTVLESVRSADPRKPDVDRLRADIQRQLLALAARLRPPAPVRDRDRENTRRP